MKNHTETVFKKQDASELPSALTYVKDKLKGKTPAVFLDYDGCLSPIVKDPDKAYLGDDMKQTLMRLAEVCPVAVVSGRDRANVQKLVDLDNLYYAGSHGFDISGPNNMHTEPGGAKEALPALDEAEKHLKEELQGVEGVLVERKRYAIAVHYRNVPDEQVSKVKNVTEATIEMHKALKKGLGKKIIELKPNLDWHKGKAVLWLIEELELNTPEYMPLYIGDDITDEDAFAALQGLGIGVLVGEHDEKTAASYRLENVEEVNTFLQMLTEQANQRENA